MKKIVIVLASSIVLSACVTLDDINTSLGQVNEVLGAGNTASSKTYNVGNKSDSQFEITNLKLSIEHVTGDNYAIRYTGRVTNKSNKPISLFIGVPIYDKDGDYYGETNTSIVRIPPHETTKLNNLEPYAINLDKGHKLNINKLKISANRLI